MPNPLFAICSRRYFRMNDERYSIFAQLTANASDEEKAVVLELLKQDHLERRASSTPMVLARYLFAYLVSIGVFSLEIFRLAVSRQQRSEIGQATLFCASSERNTSNLHLQKLVNSSSQTFDILVLESPLKRFARKFGDLTNVRMHWCRTLTTDFGAIFRNLGCQKRLISAVVKVSEYRQIQARTLSMTLVRLLRGMSISQYLVSIEVPRLVFSLSGNACTSTIELRLKGTTETIHWLHGVGLGFKFDSFADRTLVNNEYDYQYYSEGLPELSGQPLFFPRSARTFSVPARLEDIRTVVLYSNLIHPNNKYFESGGIEVERRIAPADIGQVPGKELVVKPHPSAIPLLGDRLGSYMRLLQQFGFRLQTETDNFVSKRTLYLSTVSTSFIDLIATGKCVFMYDKFADRSSGFK